MSGLHSSFNRSLRNLMQRSLFNIAAKSAAKCLSILAGPSAFAALMLTMGAAVTGVRADRIVLAPEGRTLGPQDIKAEFAYSPYRSQANYTWFQIASSEGIEFEGQRASLFGDRKNRYGFNIQYPLLSDFGAYPAVSVGIRDLLGTGLERRSVYFAASRAFALSDRQLKFVRELRLSAGAGTGTMDGPFVGIQARFRFGLTVNAEIYRHRPNISLSLPLTRHVQARAYSLDGNVFYGVAYTLTH